MANPRFKAHGEFKTYIDGNLFITEVTGPWNKELVEEWSADALRQLQSRPSKGPVAAITIIHRSILCTPEALAALRLSVAYAAHHLQCLGTVIVAAPDVEGRKLFESTYNEIYAGLTPHWYCDDFDSAKAWALALLEKHRT